MTFNLLHLQKFEEGNNKQLTLYEPVIRFAVMVSIGLYAYTCFSASLSSFLSPVKVFKEFLQCIQIGYATSTGLKVEIATQRRDKYVIANYI